MKELLKICRLTTHVLAVEASLGIQEEQLDQTCRTASTSVCTSDLLLSIR